MLRKRLFFTVAAAPMLALAAAAHAETVISTATTVPVATSKANSGAPDDVHISNTGSITLTAGPAIVTLDSNNTVLNKGALTASNVDNIVGISVTPGVTGKVTLGETGVIKLDETAAAADTDSDGDVDTPFATGTNRTGILVQGAFDGSVVIEEGASIAITGKDSAGIVINGPITGSLTRGGSLTVVGDRGIGIAVAGSVGGDVKISGAALARGEGSRAVVITGDVAGQINLSGGIGSIGYRTAERPLDAAVRAKLDADDLLQAGAGMTVAGNVGGGVIISKKPTLSDTDTDVDNDGVEDTKQTTGSVVSYGSAPALLIGSDTRDITLGKVVTGGADFGLIINGEVAGNGVFDNVSVRGLQIGTAAGKATTVEGGVLNTGTISAIAYSAPTLGMELGTGASVSRLVNSGAINSSVLGDATSAVAVRDLSGSLLSIENTGSIRAAISPDKADPTGQIVALDLSVAKGGVSIVQTQSTVKDAAAPRILGDIRLGAFGDTVDIQAGQLTGALSFGAGADVLSVGGGAAVKGEISDSDGALTLNIGKGELQLSNSKGVLQATSLNLASDGVLLFTADPNAGTIGALNAGSATLADGASIGLTVNDYLIKDSTYTVLTAGTLNAGAIKDVASENAPYLFVSKAQVNGNAVDVTVRKRTPGELGFTKSETESYEGVYASLRANGATVVGQSILAATNKSDLLNRYEQLLPDQGDVLFGALEAANLALAEGVGQKPDQRPRFGPDSFWLREVNLRTERERGDTIGGESETFGFAAGYEAMGFGKGDGGALGLTLSYMNSEAKDAAAQVGERTTANVASAGVYWRGQVGALTYSIGGQGGLSRFIGVRRYLSPFEGIDLTSKSRWNGTMLSAYGSVSYEARLGRFYARPSADAAYMRLTEDEHVDAGGGAGFDLKVHRRTSSRLVGQAMFSIGAEFGGDFWWRPELQLGYRGRTGGSVGETTAEFTTGGAGAFTMPAISDQGAPVIGVALRAGSNLSYMAIEAEAEMAESETRYQLNLHGRVMF